LLNVSDILNLFLRFLRRMCTDQPYRAGMLGSETPEAFAVVAAALADPLR
jgi:hypothetical protein